MAEGETRPATEEEVMPGLLKQAPDWMCMLVQSLSGEDRLAMFQVCKQLANVVVQSAPNVTLDMNAREYSTLQLERRRHTIARLLDVDRDFRLLLREPDMQSQPFPMELSCRVTAVTVPCASDALDRLIPRSCFAWEIFKNLQKLEWSRPMARRDIEGLCDAVTGGQLQQLRSFVFKNPEAIPWVSAQALEHLVHVLGPRVSHLGTDDAELLTHIPRFTSLQSISISGATIQCTTARQLCGHPELRKVSLRHCFVWGDHSQCSCNWEVLVLEGTRLREGAFLPLHSLQAIHFVGDVPQRPLLVAVLQQQQSNPSLLVCCEPACEPYSDSNHGPAEVPIFKLHYLSPEVLQLLPHIQSTRNGCAVHLEGASSNGLSLQPNVLFDLWRAMPPHVHGVCFNCLALTGCIGWQQLWQGLPRTITEVCFEGCEIMPICILSVLVHTAPLHLSTIRFVFGITRALNDWEANGMRMIAPKHLQVDMVYQV